MARRSSGEEEKDSNRARETRPTGPEGEGVERPIWQEPRPTERARVPDTDPAGIIVPEFKEGADEGDPAAVVWPDFKEGPESIDTETEDDDWADEDAETEVDVDLETDEDVDTFEEVEIDDERD